MYVMVKVQTDVLTTINGDFDFTQKLLEEESVFVLPGQRKCSSPHPRSNNGERDNLKLVVQQHIHKVQPTHFFRNDPSILILEGKLP
ncbi:hypothetical protein PsorP6_001223 [Peronosclerospora sorghi]|uniref:Uncharacterized protein n=1 Tax=Peronosclerospora sorghi TaxID=230839 RepID=A0ACC0WY71_9STRA|nr:hypothetical protein PsorP6_001223 [Peronosclerospora sorghi]